MHTYIYINATRSKFWFHALPFFLLFFCTQYIYMSEPSTCWSCRVYIYFYCILGYFVLSTAQLWHGLQGLSRARISFCMLYTRRTSLYCITRKTSAKSARNLTPEKSPGWARSSKAVWKSRWSSWAPRRNEPYGFCGRKATLNHAYIRICHSLSLICQPDIRGH